ncbi:hypothetical protein TDB9533_02997 [Thalassocella blandensis]|nr:hypothetical protein TDB9533_02997 [Thalassocella blandensis]
MKIAHYTSLLTIALCLCLSACDKEAAKEQSSVESAPKTEAKPTLDAQKLQTANNYLFAQGEEAIDSSLESAQLLTAAINSFLATPSQQSLAQAQQQWIAIALAYRQFFYDKQIALVDPGSFAELNKADFRIGTFPIQPGFIDAFGEYKYSGMVFDAGFELTKESLSHQHGLTDVSEVVLGIHAIEFLLFNIDGKRQAEDFNAVTSLSESDKENGYQKAAELPNNRRREILRLQADILLDDLRELKNIWLSQELTRGTWLALSAGQQTSKAKRTLTNSLTNLMVEIGDINAEATEDRELTVPPSILNNTFSIKRQYLTKALSSCQAGVLFLAEEGKLKEKKKHVEKLLNEALAHLATAESKANNDKKDSQAEASDDKKHTEFWQTAFSNLKEITEALLKN